MLRLIERIFTDTFTLYRPYTHIVLLNPHDAQAKEIKTFRCVWTDLTWSTTLYACKQKTLCAYYYCNWRKNCMTFACFYYTFLHLSKIWKFTCRGLEFLVTGCQCTTIRFTRKHASLFLERVWNTTLLMPKTRLNAGYISKFKNGNKIQCCKRQRERERKKGVTQGNHCVYSKIQVESKCCK